MTKNGKMIMEIIYASEEHLTAEQIFLRAKEQAPRIVLATIYNNLNALVAEGIVRRVKLDGSPDRYDRNTRHDHLVCDRCGRLTDVHLEDLSEKLERETGLAIESYDLNIHYLCDKCRKEMSS